MLLQSLHLSFFIVIAWNRRWHGRLPVVNEDSVQPRRLFRTQGCREVLALESAALTAHAHSIGPVRHVLVFGSGSCAGHRIADPVPAVFHIGNASCKRLFTLPRRPVVARRHPFIDKFFCSCLEEVDPSTGQSQNHAMRALSVVSRRRQRMR